MSSAPTGGGGGEHGNGGKRISNSSPINLGNEYNEELAVEDIKSLISKTSKKKSSYGHDTFSSDRRYIASTPRSGKRNNDSINSSTEKHRHHHHHHHQNSSSTGREKVKSDIPHDKENTADDPIRRSMGRMGSSSDSSKRKFLDYNERKGSSIQSFPDPDYIIDIPSSPDSTSSDRDMITYNIPAFNVLQSVGYPGVYRTEEERNHGAIEVSSLSSSLKSFSFSNNSKSKKHANRRGSDGHHLKRNDYEQNNIHKQAKTTLSSSSSPIRGNNPYVLDKALQEEQQAEYHHKNKTEEPTTGGEHRNQNIEKSLNHYSSSMSTTESVMSDFENVLLNSCCSSSSQEYVQDESISTGSPYSLHSTQELLRRGHDVLAKAAEILVEDSTADSFAKRIEKRISSVFSISEDQDTQQVKSDSLSSSTSKTVQEGEYSISLFHDGGDDPEKGSSDNQQQHTSHTTTTTSYQSQRQILKRLKLTLIERVQKKLKSSDLNDNDETSIDDSKIGNNEETKKKKDMDRPKEGLYGHSLYTTVTICMIFALIIGSIVVVIVLSLTSSQSNMATTTTPEQEDVTLSTDLHTPSLPPHPTVSELSPRMDSLVSLLGSMVSTTPNATFHDPWSPQFRAMTWLADEDPASMNIDEENKFLLMERYAIMVLYFTNGIDAPILHEKYNFKTDLHVCSWNDPELGEGISCRGEYVSEIVLPDSNLQSKIPTELTLLRRLHNVVLDDNFLSGTLPKQMFGLPELQVLQISNNRLQGPIGFVGGLPRIRRIDISRNRLSGSLPTFLSDVPDLEVLNLMGNLFHSNIPKAYGNIQSLIELDLSKNHLTSTLPSELGSLASLSTLYLHENNLWGTIPEEFEFLVNLNRFKFHDTGIDGDVDPILCAVDYLSFDELTSNCLGSDPQVICTCCTRCCSSGGGCGAHPWDRE